MNILVEKTCYNYHIAQVGKGAAVNYYKSKAVAIIYITMTIVMITTSAGGTGLFLLTPSQHIEDILSADFGITQTADTESGSDVAPGAGIAQPEQTGPGTEAAAGPGSNTAAISGSNATAGTGSKTSDKFDNKKLSWNINLNTEHKPPGISQYTKGLVDKYNVIYLGNTSRKVIYLTFDAGYEAGYTAGILDTLKKDNVKSIFFVTGPYIKSNPGLVRRMLNEGHQVGDHTINHYSLPTLSDASVTHEIAGLDTRFKTAFGVGFKYMRPPMGEYNERVLSIANGLGYKTVFWSFAYEDYDQSKQKGADHAYNIVMKYLHNGAVLLLHAVSRDNAEALDRIIKGIEAEGYTLSPFDL